MYHTIYKTIVLLVEVGLISGKVNIEKLSRMVFLEMLSRENVSLMSFLKDVMKEEDYQNDFLDTGENSFETNPLELTEREKILIGNLLEKDIKG